MWLKGSTWVKLDILENKGQNGFTGMKLEYARE